MFKGFGVEVKAGDCHLILQHILEVICAGDKFKAERFIDLLAWQVQNVGRASRIIVVMFSEPQQIGKGLIAVDLLQMIWGSAWSNIGNKEPLTGRFNDVWAGCAIGVLDEVAFAGDREVSDAIKRISAATHMKLEGKGLVQIDYPMGVNLYLLSNHRHAAHIEKGDQRHWVFECSSHRQGDDAYFEAVYAEMQNGGAEAFLDLLQKRDVSNFTPQRDCPRDNEAKKEMQAASAKRGSIANWLSEVVVAASFNPARVVHGVPTISFSGQRIDNLEEALEAAKEVLKTAKTDGDRN
jgi:putative DNA primase/helicase